MSQMKRCWHKLVAFVRYIQFQDRLRLIHILARKIKSYEEFEVAHYNHLDISVFSDDSMTKIVIDGKICCYCRMKESWFGKFFLFSFLDESVNHEKFLDAHSIAFFGTTLDVYFTDPERKHESFELVDLTSENGSWWKYTFQYLDLLIGELSKENRTKAELNKSQKNLILRKIHERF